TPVPAGIDRFSRDLIARYFATPGPGQRGFGVPVERVLELGAEDYEGGDPAVFNMAVMGFRLAQRANGVSRLHGEVSRRMFAGLWPGFDVSEVPIGSITNGVHAPTWVGRELLELEARSGGSGTPGNWDVADQLDEAELWEIKNRQRAALVRQARERLRESARARGASEAELGWIDDALDPNILTIGFARRVPSYKRLTL